MNSFFKNIALVLGLVIALGTIPFAMAMGDAAEGKVKAVQCAACHGPDGNSPVSAFPKIAGLGEKYLLKQLEDIKEGKRNVPQMVGQLDNFNEQDLQDIAAYFAAQPMQLTGSEAIAVRLNNGESVDGLIFGQNCTVRAIWKPACPVVWAVTPPLAKAMHRQDIRDFPVSIRSTSKSS